MDNHSMHQCLASLLCFSLVLCISKVVTLELQNAAESPVQRLYRETQTTFSIPQRYSTAVHEIINASPKKQPGTKADKKSSGKPEGAKPTPAKTVACKLDEDLIKSIYSTKTRTWLIDDSSLKAIKSDVGALIRCTKKRDIVLFSTTKTIRPKHTIVISWPLTIGTSIKEAPTKGQGRTNPTPTSETKLTCPKSGPLLLMKSTGVKLVNLLITRCGGTDNVVKAASTNCKKDTSKASILFHRIRFHGHSLGRNQRILDASNFTCGVLKMQKLSLLNNLCDGEDCIKLAPRSEVSHIRVFRNFATDHLVSKAIFTIPEASTVSFSKINATENEIRVFYASPYSTLNINESCFKDNIISKAFLSSKEFLGGSVLFADLSVQAEISYSNFTNNTAYHGGAILCYSNTSLLLHHTVFLYNGAIAGSGGAIQTWLNSNLSVSESVFEYNGARVYGGAIFIEHESQLLMNNTKFVNNSAIYGGSTFIKHDSKAEIKKCTFLENRAIKYGGAIEAWNGSFLALSGSTFTNNIGRVYAGGVYVNNNSALVLSNSDFVNNTARYGGALMVRRLSKGKVSGCTFTANQVEENGGAIDLWQKAKLKLTQCSFTENSGNNGGAVYVNSQCKMTISVSEFITNTAGFGGALVVHDTSNVSILTTGFTDNHAAFGGSIYIDEASILKLQSSTVNDGVAVDGGGMYSEKAATILCKEVSFQRNNARKRGGAIYTEGKTKLRFEDLKFEGNEARRGQDCFVKFKGISEQCPMQATLLQA